MRHLPLILSAALIATPAVAQDDTEKGFGLMELGAELILRGLMQEVEPAMDDLQSMIEDFGPALEEITEELAPVLSDILARVDDIRHYDAPEILPNGDIIMRRSKDAPDFVPDMVPDADGAIDL